MEDILGMAVVAGGSGGLAFAGGLVLTRWMLRTYMQFRRARPRVKNPYDRDHILLARTYPGDANSVRYGESIGELI